MLKQVQYNENESLKCTTDSNSKKQTRKAKENLGFLLD